MQACVHACCNNAARSSAMTTHMHFHAKSASAYATTVLSFVTDGARLHTGTDVYRTSFGRICPRL